MAISGSVDFNLDRDEIIRAAMRKLGVLALGQNPTAEQINNGSTALNAMAKAWQAQGLHLWKYETIYVFLAVAQKTYRLGPNGDRATTDFVTHTTSNAAVTTQTSIQVDSIASISSGDNIGIQLTDNSLFWTTVNGAPSGTTVNLTSALTGNVNVGAVVYSYTTSATRPLRLSDGRRRIYSGTTANTQELPLGEDGMPMARSDYMGLPNKDAAGYVVQYYYNPNLNQGTLYTWPVTTIATDILAFTSEAAIDDFDNITDDPDFPQEWLNALIWNLAVELGPEYGVDMETMGMVTTMAATKLQEAMDFDRETASIQFQPDLRPY